jgi:alkylation response protein AidB-like acyl-CoA dehydrogenase
VHELDAGRLALVDAVRARWWCTELLHRVVDACVELHGGYGGATQVRKSVVGRPLDLAAAR